MRGGGAGGVGLGGGARERAKREKREKIKLRPIRAPHIYTYLSRSRPPVIRVKIDFFPLP